MRELFVNAGFNLRGVVVCLICECLAGAVVDSIMDYVIISRSGLSKFILLSTHIGDLLR